MNTAIASADPTVNPYPHHTALTAPTPSHRNTVLQTKTHKNEPTANPTIWPTTRAASIVAPTSS